MRWERPRQLFVSTLALLHAAYILQASDATKQRSLSLSLSAFQVWGCTEEDGDFRLSLAGKCGSLASPGEYITPVTIQISIGEKLYIVGEEYVGVSRVLPVISGANDHRIFTVSNGELKLKSVVLKGGKDEGLGGAIFVLFEGLVEVDQSLFIGNIAESGGAVAAVDNSKVVLSSCEFRDNTAKNGEDIMLEKGSIAKIVNAFFASHNKDAVWAEELDVKKCSDNVCADTGMQLAHLSDCTDLSNRHGAKCVPENIPVVTAISSDSCTLEARTDSTAHSLTGCPTAKPDTIVKVQGSGFGKDVGTVIIGGLLAHIESWDTQKISFVLPKNVGQMHRLLIQRQDDNTATNYHALVVMGIDLYGAIGDFISYSLPKVVGVIIPDSAKNCSNVPMHKGLTTGNEFMELHGYGFGPRPAFNNTTGIRVMIGGRNCSNVSWINDSMITALTPRGTGKDIPLLVFVGNGVSFPTLFSYLRPYISNVSVHMHGGILLMTGKHFGVPGTSVTISLLATREDAQGSKTNVQCRNIVHNSDAMITCDYETWGSINTCSGFLITVNINGQISNRFPICYGNAAYEGSLRYIKPAKELSIVEGTLTSDRVYLSVEPYDICKEVKVKVSSATPSICQVTTKVFTLSAETAVTGKEIIFKALDDGIISSQTAPKPEPCQITYNLLSSDKYYERVEETNRFLVIFGKGCGTGEYLGIVERENNGSACVCNNNYFRDSDGYCRECPEGGICDNIGTTLVNMKTKRNFWRESDTKSLFYACDENGGELDRDTPCIGGYAANATQCAKGHTGILCAVCQAGYVKRDRPNYIYGGTLCRNCDQSVSESVRRAQLSSAIVVTITIAYGFTLVYITRSLDSYHRTLPVDADNELVIQQLAAGKNAGILMVSRALVLLRHFQCVSFLGITFGVDWPFHFRSFFQWFGFLNLDVWNILSGFDVCSLVIPFQDSSIVHLTTPAMFLAIIGVANVTTFLLRLMLFWKPCKKCAESKACETFREHTTRTTLLRSVKLFSVVLFIQLPGLVVRAFRVFRCRDMENIGLVMRDSVSIACGSLLNTRSVFGKLAIISGSFAVVYGVIFPMTFLFVLGKNKLWGDVGVARNMQHIYGFLYMNYRPELCTWWGQLDTVVRMLIFGVLAVVQPDTSMQLYFAVIFAIGYVLLVEEFRPFRQTVDNRIFTASWVLIVLTLVTGFALRTDIERRVYDHTSLSIFLVLLHSVFLLVVSFSAFALPARSAKLDEQCIPCLARCRLAKFFNYCGQSSGGNTGKLVKTAPLSMATGTGPRETSSTDDKHSHIEHVMRRHTKDNIRLDKKMKLLQKRHSFKVQSRVQARQKLKNSKTLSKVSVFNKLTDAELNQAIDAMVFETFKPGAVVYEEGTYGDKLYTIVDGTVNVIKDGQPVREMNAPDVFGEGALLQNDYKRTASIFSITAVSLMSLSRPKYLELRRRGSFSENTSVPEELQKRLENYRTEDEKRIEEGHSI